MRHFADVNHESRWSVASAVGVLVVLLLSMWLVARLETPTVKRTMVIGHSVEGRPLVTEAFGHAQGGVLFIASIHGNEGVGTPLLEAFSERLSDMQLSESVWLIKNANPDGLAHRQRLNVNGVDLNRNFPAENRRDRKRFGSSALSEPESRALHAFIEQAQPRLIVSIHQPIACVDYDGPPEAKAIAQTMAQACDLPLRKLGARPGSLGAYFGETIGRPIITLELPSLAPHDPKKLWRRYGPALLAVLKKLV